MKILTIKVKAEIQDMLKSRSLSPAGRKYLREILSGKRPYPKNERDLMATGIVPD